MEYSQSAERKIVNQVVYTEQNYFSKYEGEIKILPKNKIVKKMLLADLPYKKYQGESFKEVEMKKH